MSKLFRLDSADWWQSAVNAVIVAVVVSLAGVFQTPDFNVFAADWMTILPDAFNTGLKAFFGFIGANLLTTKEGNLMGMVKVK